NGWTHPARRLRPLRRRGAILGSQAFSDLGGDVACHLKTDFLLSHLRLAPGLLHGNFLLFETFSWDAAPGREPQCSIPEQHELSCIGPPWATVLNGSASCFARDGCRVEQAETLPRYPPASALATSQRTPRSQDSSVLPRISTR